MWYGSPHDIIMQAGIVYHSEPQWMILNGRTVRGLTVYCDIIFMLARSKFGWAHSNLHEVYDLSLFKTTIDYI